MFENVNVRGVPLTDADILKAQLVERMDPDDADFYDQTWSAILKALALNSVEALPDLSKIEVKAVSTTHGGPLSDILKRSRGQKVRVLAGTGSDEGKGDVVLRHMRRSMRRCCLSPPACCGRLW